MVDVSRTCCVGLDVLGVVGSPGVVFGSLLNPLSRDLQYRHLLSLQYFSGNKCKCAGLLKVADLEYASTYSLRVCGHNQVQCLNMNLKAIAGNTCTSLAWESNTAHV